MDWRQHRDLARELRVKVGRVRWATDLGEEWWRHLLVQDVLPIDALEEWVSLDLLCISLATAESLFGVTSQELKFISKSNRWQRLVK